MQDARVDAIARWLRLFVEPGQVTELRAIGKQVFSRAFTGDELVTMAEEAVRQDGLGAKGVYFVPNPLRPEFRTAGRAARDEDVTRRRWLLIDVDPVRPVEKSATEAERLAAWNVLNRCRGALLAAGFGAGVIGDSGNGWHLCQPIDMPNDAKARDHLRDLLKHLNRQCGDKTATVDLKTFNAARIWKLYGSRARKGAPEQDRPHRQSRVIEGH